MNVTRLVDSREWPRFRYVKPPKAMRRKLGHMIRKGLILRRRYLLAVPV